MTRKRAYCKANASCRAVYRTLILLMTSLQGSRDRARHGHYLITSIFITVYAPLTLSAANFTLSPALT